MIYLGTHDMPIYHFIKCLVKNDLRYMVIGWNERDEIEIPEDAEETWFEIFNSYSDKTKTNETDIYYALINEIDYLRRRFFILEMLVRDINENNRELYGRELNLWGFNYNTEKLIEDQKKDFEREFRIAKQEIELKENELQRMMKENEQGEPISLYKRKIRLERVLGVKIDLKTTVIDEWIEIIKEAEEVNEQYKKATLNHGN